MMRPAMNIGINKIPISSKPPGYFHVPAGMNRRSATSTNPAKNRVIARMKSSLFIVISPPAVEQSPG